MESQLPSELPAYMHEELKEPAIEQQKADEPVRRPGRMRLPLLWTRVISMKHDSLDEITTHIVNQDIEIAGAMVRPPLKRNRPGDGEQVFWPKDEFDGRKDLNLDSNTLTEPKLRKYAQMISKLRQRLRKTALQSAEEDSEQIMQINPTYLTRLTKRMHKGYFPRNAATD